MSFTSCFLLTVTFFTKSNSIKKKKEKLEKRACTGRGSRIFSTSTPFSSSALHVLLNGQDAERRRLVFTDILNDLSTLALLKIFL